MIVIRPLAFTLEKTNVKAVVTTVDWQAGPLVTNGDIPMAAQRCRRAIGIFARQNRTGHVGDPASRARQGDRPVQDGVLRLRQLGQAGAAPSGAVI